MGPFWLWEKKQPPLDEGERLYRQALSAGGMWQEMEYLEQSVALGNRHAKAALARCYWKNFSDEADKIQKAAALLDEAEADGALLDSGLAGRVYEKAGRREDAAKYYLAAAKEGDVWAQFKTGWNCANGVGMAQDDAQGGFLVQQGRGGRQCRRRQQPGRALSQGPGRPAERPAGPGAAGTGGEAGRWDRPGEPGLELLPRHGPLPPGRPKRPPNTPRPAWTARTTTAAGAAAMCGPCWRARTGAGVRDRWDNAVYALRRLADEGFTPAKEGLELLNRQEEERTTGLYRKALESGDVEMMDQAARNGCFDAELYLLKDAARAPFRRRDLH